MSTYPYYNTVGNNFVVYNIPGTSILHERRKICTTDYPVKDMKCNVEGCNRDAEVRAHVSDNRYAILSRSCRHHNSNSNVSLMRLKYGSKVIYLKPLEDLQKEIDIKIASKSKKNKYTSQMTKVEPIQKEDTHSSRLVNALAWMGGVALALFGINKLR